LYRHAHPYIACSSRARKGGTTGQGGRIGKGAHYTNAWITGNSPHVEAFTGPHNILEPVRTPSLWKVMKIFRIYFLISFPYLKKNSFKSMYICFAYFHIFLQILFCDL
jgi:hypothetical protein